MAAFRPSEFRFFFGPRARVLYELIGWHLRNATHLRFMNYGYAMDAGAPALALRPEDEAERYCAQLYHAVAGQVDLTGKRVLDIGSGRGGGAAFVHRYHGTREMVGCDLAECAVSFCRRVYAGVEGLSYRRGNAMSLPFGANEFDAVTSVESSHCYPDAAAFLAEVHRVLRPGGSFLYADFTPPRIPPRAARERTVAALTQAGFGPVEVTDITANIVTGLERDQARRAGEIARRFPAGTRRLVRLWAGLPGSWIHRDFVEGRRDYIMYCAAKPARTAVPGRRGQVSPPARVAAVDPAE